MRSACGLVRKPWSRSHASSSHCVCGKSPSRAPAPYTQSDSGRSAVMPGSSWRSEPAAAFRGFGAGFLPAATWASLKRANPVSGK